MSEFAKYGFVNQAKMCSEPHRFFFNSFNEFIDKLNESYAGYGYRFDYSGNGADADGKELKLFLTDEKEDGTNVLIGDGHIIWIKNAFWSDGIEHLGFTNADLSQNLPCADKDALKNLNELQLLDRSANYFRRNHWSMFGSRWESAWNYSIESILEDVASGKEVKKFINANELVETENGKVDLPYIKVFLSKDEFIEFVKESPFTNYDDVKDSIDKVEFPIPIINRSVGNAEYDEYVLEYINKVSKERGYVKE